MNKQSSWDLSACEKQLLYVFLA